MQLGKLSFNLTDKAKRGVSYLNIFFFSLFPFFSEKRGEKSIFFNHFLLKNISFFQIDPLIIIITVSISFCPKKLWIVLHLQKLLQYCYKNSVTNRNNWMCLFKSQQDTASIMQKGKGKVPATVMFNIRNETTWKWGGQEIFKK